MKRYMRTGGILIWVLTMAAAYFIAVSHAGRLEECERTALILMESNPLTLEQVRQMQEREQKQDIPRSFTAWRQKNEVTAENKDLQRRHTVSAVAICGRSDLLIHGSAWLDEEDIKGCLIDEKTAYALFGSTGVAGQTIYIGGKEKVIRGILYNVSNTVLYEEDEKTECFTNLTVYMENGVTYDNIRQDFMMRHGLEGRFVRMDILKRIADLACFKFRMPADMIPTKWSDFGFWEEALQKEKESFLLLLLTEKQKPMELYMKEFYPAVGYGVLAICMAAVIMGKICTKCMDLTHFCPRMMK